MNRTLRPSRDFTPAVPVLGAYDPIVSLFTQERRWRSALLSQLAPKPGEVIADIGCGTGSFLVLLALLGKDAAPGQLVGIDPDERILERARRKLADAGVACELRQGYLRDAARLLAPLRPDKIVSSLVLHQVPLAEKRAGLAAIHAALRPGGELHMADYGLQRTRAMRWLFKLVQAVDGVQDTQPNADGIVPALMREAGFAEVEETAVIPTPTGSISLYRGIRPATDDRQEQPA
ncbi:Ubiquinone/menaquinone biosynthesis C-methylase UbiE [Variovorax sp. YR750]|uniref:class I SAM-dependent methyltransferase n=1 Tax=Variovorax sp. YR750 TaxID=1884384 RepID=UPI0008C0DF5E|nr:class I SAM-dependent methyltransferase [Variovorax sp. YR750]SEM34022.1 Ubiquinone/menaquinone biosynthesis C-methylase UbiE [Variovorax sp. YR750]